MLRSCGSCQDETIRLDIFLTQPFRLEATSELGRVGGGDEDDGARSRGEVGPQGCWDEDAGSR